MIYINERPTSKVPGLTSVFIKFDFNRDIVNELKKIECFNYSKRTNEWEVPITYLDKVIDSLCVYDDIDLNLCNINISKDIKYDVGPFITDPFDYQLDGINYGLNHDKFLLLDVPGLGKTLQMIYIAEERKKRNNLEHCLIICGLNSLKSNWEKEIKKHSKLDCRILGKKVNSKGTVTYGSISDRLEELKKPIDEFFVIINIETLRNNDIVKEINKSKVNKFNMIMLDEAHVVKNSSSQQGSNLLKLDKCDYKIAATGTPMLNNPLDMFVPLKWIEADSSTKTNFDNYYCSYGGVFGNDFLGYRNLDTIKTQLELFSIRRHKDLLDLPPKNVINQYVTMSPEQLKFYEDVKNGIKEDIDKITLKQNIVMSMVLRLRQATAYPSILTSKPIPSAKIDRACELVEEIVANGDKVLIFSTFKQTLSELERRLKHHNPLIGTGDVSDEDLSIYNDMFQQNDENKVFLATWQRCGTGLTYNRACYMIFIDTPWTDGAFQQACDRIHRVGTRKPVFIYNLITEDSIDEKVFEILSDKAALTEFVVDNEVDAKSLKSLQKYIEELK